MWVFLLFPIWAALGAPFVTTWATPSTSPHTVQLSPIATQTNVTIDWGDNSPHTAIDAGNLSTPSHDYAVAGSFNVSVYGEFRWKNNHSLAQSNLTDIVSWGDGFLVDSGSTNLFSNYASLRVSAGPNTHPVFLPGAILDQMFGSTSFDSPLNWDLANITSIAAMFFSTPLNKPVTFSNTQGVRSLQSVFSFATKFNQPFSFDCTSVTTLEGMFFFAEAFNSPLNLTNTHAVNSTSAMFYGAISFNQPVVLDTRSVANMGLMFGNATSFNQPVSFNTSQVQIFETMFAFATSFNQPLSMDMSRAVYTRYMLANASSFVGPVNFTSLKGLAYASGMFAGATAFSQDLSQWDVSNVSMCETFCPYCVLPTFPNCTDNPCAPATKFTNSLNQSVCSTRAPTTLAPSMAPSSPGNSSSPSVSAANCRQAAKPLLLLLCLFLLGVSLF